MTDFQPGTIRVRQGYELDQFDLEISSGNKWYGLNDHLNYIVTADSFSTTAVDRRRITVQSPVYDGTFEVHSVLENVEEKISLYVLGQSQNEVTENLLAVIDLFSQFRYNVRKRLDDHMETWSCMPASYTIDRTHVNAHNIRATITFAVPRFPKVVSEVVL